MLRKRAGEKFRGDVHDGNDALVSHARRANHTDGAYDLPVHFVRRGDHAAFVKRHQARLVADENLHAVGTAADVEELQQGGLLFEQIKQLSQVCHVGRQVLHVQQVVFA